MRLIPARIGCPLHGPRLALCLAALMAWGSRAAARPQGGNLEYEIKAEFVQRFAYYIEWPPHAFESDSSAFNICVEGESPMLENLRRVLAKRRIKGRPALVTALKAGESAAGCHILFISPSEWERVGEIVRQTSRTPVLTIAESLGFASQGVHILLFLDGPHVRFSINAGSAKESGLNMSAKLLALARPFAAGKP